MANEPRISVLHLIHTMAYGGIETVVLNWIRGMDRTRFDVHLACFANPGGTEQPFVEAAERQGLTVHKLPWGRGKPVLKAAGELVRLARRFRVDIVHSHNCYADLVSLAAAWRLPVKTITTVYVWCDLDWKRNLIQAINRAILPFFDRITAHCEFTRIETVRRGFPEAKITTLICGFETHPVTLSVQERLGERRARGVRDDELLLVNIARLYPEKAQDALLRIFARIRERHPNTRLWIAGVGPLEAELKALCARLGLDRSVEFIGFITDLPRLLALADIQVHPAHIEGVALAICEGMAAGLPIVASAVGGLSEVLSYGENGLLVPPGDEAAFVDAVCSVIDDPDLGRRLGAAARRFIQHDYSLKTAVAAVEQTYRELLGGWAVPGGAGAR